MSASSFEVDLRFHTPPAIAAGAAAPRGLRYAVCSLEKTQKRFDDRAVLWPEIDPKRYTARAVVDWVDVGIETGQSTRRDFLGNTLAGSRLRPWVKATGGSTNGSGHKFVITFQEPDPARLRADLELLKRKVDLVATPWVSAIEIALDWRPKDRTDRSRWLMTAAMQRCFLPEAQWISSELGRPRFVYGEDRPSKPKYLYDVRWRACAAAKAADAGRIPGTSLGGRPRSPLAGHNSPYIDSTLYHGAEDAQVMFRVQDKIADQRRGAAAVALGPADRRTRVEVTLRHEELAIAGLATVDDLYGFRFEKHVADYFGFWLPTVDAAGPARQVQIEIFRRSGVYGLEIYQAQMREEAVSNNGGGAGGGTYALKTGARRAFTPLKRRSFQALNRLSGRWGRGS